MRQKKSFETFLIKQRKWLIQHSTIYYMDSVIPRFPTAKMFPLLKTTASGILHKMLTCLSIEKDFKGNAESDRIFSVATDYANHGDKKLVLIRYLLVHGQNRNNPLFSRHR